MEKEPVHAKNNRSDSNENKIVSAELKSDNSIVEMYPGLFLISSNIAGKILLDEIPFEVLDFASVVLKRQFSVQHGLVLPSRLYAHVLEKRPVSAFECVSSNCTAGRIHYVQGHYVVSYQFITNITVYDSLP